MSWSDTPDPNSNLKFHFFLLGLALFNVLYGIGLLSVPLIAWVLARWLFMFLAVLDRKAAERAVGEWNGRYYAFSDRQLRVHWDEAGIWVDADDLFRAAGRSPDQGGRKRIRLRLGAQGYCVPAGLERECLSQESALLYLAGLDDDLSCKLRRWLEREVFPNIISLRERNADAYRQFVRSDPDGR